jgi:hypothetical protein
MAVHGRLYLKVVFMDLLMGRTTLCDSGKLIFGSCARTPPPHNLRQTPSLVVAQFTACPLCSLSSHGML